MLNETEEKLEMEGACEGEPEPCPFPSLRNCTLFQEGLITLLNGSQQLQLQVRTPVGRETHFCLQQKPTDGHKLLRSKMWESRWKIETSFPQTPKQPSVSQRQGDPRIMECHH